MSIILFHLLWLVFVNLFELTPSNAEREYFPTKNYDSEFIPFMKKMYSAMPGPKKIKQEKKGPNEGYRPYWYGYNYQLHGKPKQANPSWAVDDGAGGAGGWGASSHEDWDGGLGMGSGAALWGAGNHSLTARGRHNRLGAAALMDRDLEVSGEAPQCFANMGPNCDLGRPAWNYTHAELMALKTKTEWCDQCQAHFQKVGMVCTIDHKARTQDMDYCVMLKMNCLGGTAYRAGDAWRYNGQKHSKVPFAMMPQWIRFACRGWKDAEVKMFAVYPSKWAIYWVVVYGWPATGPKSAVYPDFDEPYETDYLYKRIDRYWGWATNDKNFTEYTIVWNTNTGWFLISQPRQENWKDHLNMEFVDPHPRDNIRYFDVASGWSAWYMEYVLHGLKKMYDGPCTFTPAKKEQMPSGTLEMLKEAGQVEKQFQQRLEKLKMLGEDLSGLSGQNGEYIDYQNDADHQNDAYDQNDQNGQHGYANAAGKNASHHKNKKVG